MAGYDQEILLAAIETHDQLERLNLYKKVPNDHELDPDGIFRRLKKRPTYRFDEKNLDVSQIKRLYNLIALSRYD
jgi:hypothetical protein